jgi:hypothetical protein
MNTVAAQRALQERVMFVQTLFSVFHGNPEEEQEQNEAETREFTRASMQSTKILHRKKGRRGNDRHGKNRVSKIQQPHTTQKKFGKGGTGRA